MAENTRRNQRPGGVVRYIPEITAGLAVLMVIGAALLGGHPGLQSTLLTVALLVVAGGWMWSMQAQGRLLGESRQRAARLQEEKDDIERLLDASITGQPSTAAEAGVKESLVTLAESIGADAAVCYLFDPTTDALRPQPGAHGLRAGNLHDFSLDGAAAAAVVVVLHDGTPIFQATDEGPLVPGLLPKQFDTGSIAMVPMVYEEETIGLLAVAAEGSGKFGEDTLALAAVTAIDCAAVLQRERLVQAGREQSKLAAVLRDAALAINSALPLRDMLYVILGKARAIVEFDRACIALFDGNSYEVVAFVEANGELRRRAPETTRRKIAGSPYQEVARSSVSVRESLSGAYATEAPKEGIACVEALVPLRAQGDLIGCAAFRARADPGFPPRAQAALLELANLASVAVSAYLGSVKDEEATTKDHAPEPVAAPPPTPSAPEPPAEIAASSKAEVDPGLDLAAEVPLLLASTTRGPEALEHQITETIARLFDSPIAVLTRVEGEAHRVVSAVGAQGKADQPAITPGEGLLGSRDLGDGTLRMNDARPEELLPPLEAGGKISSGLGTPIKLDDVFVGAVAAFRDRPYRLADASLMKSLAEQLGVALRNADVFYRSQRTLWEVANLNQGLQAMGGKVDLAEILDALLGRVMNVAQAETGSVMLVEDGKLRVAAGRGRGKKGKELLTLEVGEGLAGRAAQARQTVVANEVASERDFVPSRVPGSMAPRSLLCVPLVVGEEAIGVINVADYNQTGAFDEESVSVVNALARQAATAVDNARLRQQLGAEMERLQQLQQVIRETLGDKP